MKIKGHRLLFGERRGAHELLLSAPEVADRAVALAASTDRPGHAGSVAWQSFSSGFPHGDFYVFAHTFPDAQSERAGMVLSEVLLLPLVEIIRLKDLRGVQKLFSATLEDVRQNTETKISVEMDKFESNLQPPLDFPLSLPAVLEFLLAVRDESKPVVWSGQNEFDEIVCALWNCLPPALRATFRFRLSFAPEDAINHNLTIVCTPSVFVNRFTGYQIASAESRSTNLQSLSIAYLLGKPEGELIKRTIEDLSCDIADLTQLKLIEQCAKYRQYLAIGELEFINHLAFLRRLARLAPDERQGGELKAEVFSNLIGRLRDQKSSESIFALNNLDLAPFAGLTDSFSGTITNWIRANFFRLPADNLITILEKAMSLKPQENVWGKAIVAGLDCLKNDWSAKIAAQLWRLWSENAELFDLTQGFLPVTTSAANDLTDACPRTLSADLGNKVRKFAAARKLDKLHAAVVASFLEPAAAFAAQIKFETSAKRKNGGFSILLERIPFDAFLVQTLNRKDDYLFKLVAAHAPKSPSLFKKMNLKQVAWQRISFFSLQRDARFFWKNLPNQTAFVFEVLNLLLTDRLEEMSLIRFAAKSDFADLTGYPQRAAVWKKLGGEDLNLFLSKTAQGWWRQFAENTDVEAAVAPENKLRREILHQDNLRRAMSESRAPISDFLRVFELFPELTDRDFADELRLVVDLPSKVSLFDANAIGKFVNKRKWRKSADEIHGLLKTRSYDNLLPALEECRNLFSLWEFVFSPTLFRLKEFKYDWDDWFKAFTECLIDLYKFGPHEKGIWERAGGEASVLLNNVSGREAWHSAIQELIKGHGGKKITTERILEEAKRDFRRNETLERLEDYFHKLK
jgi:hypothetical protein